MKQIENYNANKYNSDLYSEIENGIYEVKEDGEILYVTSLSFIQEPEFNEGANASNITQYPLEDILDKYYCYISDFYKELNTVDSQKCYQEFASPDLEDIRTLRFLIGKHVYNKETGRYVELIIE
ncbi:hypothetical protein [Clostridium intestinale]|uniref:Uncharacterized protein n=1 Tax=Clostridium intestinale DSM 6191 TaxID=1121320 RepID=A0A1M5T7P0_9CLOT|nr:hypothetical protein [Clostridium intestinale]SHH46393.1 hypothetical protein SAMN02745941_00120 [Clostridium intestinale DSM 6191]